MVKAPGTALAITGSTFSGGIFNFGTISGTTGIVVTHQPSVTVFDGGKIVGTGGIAVKLGPGTNTFEIVSGYSISGKVSGGSAGIFELGGSGSASFNLGAGGGQFVGFKTFEVLSGATWRVSGSGQHWTVAERRHLAGRRQPVRGHRLRRDGSGALRRPRHRHADRGRRL